MDSGASPSKRPVVNPTLSFLVSFCYRIGSLMFPWSGAILKKHITLVLVKGGHQKIMRAHQKTALCIRPDFIGHYKIEPFCFVLLLIVL